jgi:hypothetical protein
MTQPLGNKNKKMRVRNLFTLRLVRINNQYSLEIFMYLFRLTQILIHDAICHSDYVASKYMISA